MLKDLFSKLGGEIVVGTHNGEFHADEVFAVAALMMLGSLQGAEVTVVRSRDPAILKTCDVLVDVGGEYNVESLRFDHHQWEGAPKPRENGVKYSSFGLVWKEIGETVAPGFSHLVDRDLVQGIDAVDNGQGSVLNVFDKEGRYCEHATVSGQVANMNPTWQEMQTWNSLRHEALALASGVEDAVFSHKAGELAERLQERCFKDAAFEAMVMIRRAIASAEAEMAGLKLIEKVPQAAKVRILRVKGPDAGAMVKALSDYDSEAHFLVFLATNGEWSVQAVPPSRKDSFGQRTRFPEAWNDLRGERLALASGVEDAIFSHKFGFFACAKSEAGAIELAVKALDLRDVK